MTETASSLPDETFRPHPEAQSGEVLLCNCYADEPDEFENIDYQTKRAGKIAYDANGQVLMRYFPVFVWKVEQDNRQREVKIGQ